MSSMMKKILSSNIFYKSRERKNNNKKKINFDMKLEGNNLLLIFIKDIV